MQLSYSQLEAVLAAYMGVHPDRMSTFRSRLKQLQRLEFPPGVNIGRGSRMTYSATHLLQLAVAFELLGLGIPAGEATRLTMEHWAKFTAAFGRAYGKPLRDTAGSTFVSMPAKSPVEPPSGWRDEVTVDDQVSLFTEGQFHHGRAARILIDADRLFEEVNRLAKDVGQERYPTGSPEYGVWAEERSKDHQGFDRSDFGGIPF